MTSSNSDTRLDGWQDISTAPKDGGRIIVIGGRHSEPEIVEADGEWWRSNPSLRAVPTHWMHLPPPPSVSEEKES